MHISTNTPAHTHTHKVKSDDFTGSEAKKTHSKLVQIPK